MSLPTLTRRKIKKITPNAGPRIWFRMGETCLPANLLEGTRLFGELCAAQRTADASLQREANFEDAVKYLESLRKRAPGDGRPYVILGIAIEFVKHRNARSASLTGDRERDQ